MNPPEEGLKIRAGKGVVIPYELPEWIILLSAVALVIGICFMIWMRRRKPN